MTTAPEPILVRFALRRGEVLRYFLLTQYFRRRIVWIASLGFPGLVVLTIWLRHPQIPSERLIHSALFALLVIPVSMWLVTAVITVSRIFLTKRAAVLDACEATFDAKGVSVTSKMSQYAFTWAGIKSILPGDSIVELEIAGGFGAAVLIPRRVLSDAQITQLHTWWENAVKDAAKA